MEHTFAAISIVGAAGVVLVVAAVVGGGFTLAGAEVPVISSVIRQVLVGVVGAALLALDLAYVGAEPDPLRTRRHQRCRSPSPPTPAQCRRRPSLRRPSLGRRVLTHDRDPCGPER